MRKVHNHLTFMNYGQCTNAKRQLTVDKFSTTILPGHALKFKTPILAPRYFLLQIDAKTIHLPSWACIANSADSITPTCRTSLEPNVARP